MSVLKVGRQRSVPMIATKDSWKRVAFENGVEIPYGATFSSDEFAKIRDGLVPRDMEDKWFVYFDEHLYWHRSWTGEPVYRLTFGEAGDSVRVVEALCTEQVIKRSSPEYEAKLLHFLIRNLLLGKAEEFPMPPHSRKSIAGLIQHVISGTAFPETPATDQPRGSWWTFSRS